MFTEKHTRIYDVIPQEAWVAKCQVDLLVESSVHIIKWEVVQQSSASLDHSETAKFASKFGVFACKSLICSILCSMCAIIDNEEREHGHLLCSLNAQCY